MPVLPPTTAITFDQHQQHWARFQTVQREIKVCADVTEKCLLEDERERLYALRKEYNMLNPVVLNTPAAGSDGGVARKLPF